VDDHAFWLHKCSQHFHACDDLDITIFYW